MPCPNCNERGCKACGDTGYFKLTDCPNAKYIDHETKELVRFAEWFKKGIPPVAGGSLDQSARFMEWCNEWWKWEELLRPRTKSMTDG